MVSSPTSEISYDIFVVYLANHLLKSWKSIRSGDNQADDDTYVNEL